MPTTDERLIESAKRAAPDAMIGCFFIPGIGTADQLKAARAAGLDFVRVGCNAPDIEEAYPYLTLARELGGDGIPVLLTIQVDSVAKSFENDKVIPANVAAAANFYQSNGFVHGEPQIIAADPNRTQILGNFRFDYKTNPIECQQYPWYDRVFMKFHTEIECDPKVWNQVGSLIRSRLPQQPR